VNGAKSFEAGTLYRIGVRGARGAFFIAVSEWAASSILSWTVLEGASLLEGVEKRSEASETALFYAQIFGSTLREPRGRLPENEKPHEQPKQNSSFDKDGDV
jgi:hypothetical protein